MHVYVCGSLFLDIGDDLANRYPMQKQGERTICD
ncbi:hypothetical protein EA99_01354 [Enterococcus faecium]|nr:hypothetical protein EB27_01505 [Enterococcus faecium]RBT23298.1 hypothetical protein EA99_01354 [Enterococcus faecium]